MFTETTYLIGFISIILTTFVIRVCNVRLQEINGDVQHVQQQIIVTYVLYLK